MVDEVRGRRRRVLAVAVAMLGGALIAAPGAMAGEFTVNSILDETDTAPGDEVCLTEGGVCTLRAAIEEADSLEESAQIEFEEGTFEGQAAATIALGSSLPAVTVPVFINGRTCVTAAAISGPCVGIDGPSGEPALVFENTEEGQIWGLAITGAQIAVRVDGSPRFTAQASWFGVRLDGSPDGNGIGILIAPGSNRSLIGSEGADRRNVFAGNTGDGVDIHGATNTRVFGNYFGVGPDGFTASANGGDDIEVASTGGLEATGTSIGTRVSSAAAVSRQCDGGCNVLSGAASNGVDLEGDGGTEAPAASTAVAGNYIGLNADGTAAVPNASAGVRVGEAAHTLIGGPSSGEANRINGGGVGILAGPSAGDLAVRGNLIGTDITGAGTLVPPGDGIVVDSAELPSPSVEAEIVGNEIRMEDGIAISQRGQGAWILDNRISGSQTGIKTDGSTAEYGNVIEGNLIEGPAESGILVENDLNEIVGNSVLGAGGAGIWIRGVSLPFGVTGNVIGGNAAGEENFIADSGGDAIEIFDREKTENEVARNSGLANGDLFIDLIAVSGTEHGPNRGIQPPTFSTSTGSEASGGAEVGATVRVFRKRFAATGELESFLGEAIANSEESWKVTYGDTIPPGTIVAATQTKEGGTSELASATTLVGEGGAEGGEEGSGPGTFGQVGGFLGRTRIRPRTRIVRSPRRRSRSHTARFEFKSDEPGSVFLCKLDRKPFDLCRSPKRYAGLEPGKHVFEVRAIDPAGHADPSPARKTFTVLG
jgi:CSLREA domain-containing protein